MVKPRTKLKPHARPKSRKRWDEPWGVGLALNEAVFDAARARCVCGDSMWWRVNRSDPWRCRTCAPPDARANVYWMRKKKMVDPTEAEIAAIQATLEPAGEFLESLGETDLAKLSPEDFFTFVEVVVTAYQDNLLAINAP
jgi:hypothetical protein